MIMAMVMATTMMAMGCCMALPAPAHTLSGPVLQNVERKSQSVQNSGPDTDVSVRSYYIDASVGGAPRPSTLSMVREMATSCSSMPAA
jgi:curli biogenesis system outer membrane secretion channel CsgG